MSTTTKRRRLSTTLVKPKDAPAAQASPASPWYRTTWLLALASSVALWVPHSPLGLSPLAWLAPLGWLLIIRAEKFTCRRPYGVLYVAGFVHWLLILEGVRRAHVALYLGWIVLAAYLAVYLVLFVGISRVAVHRWRVPLCLAAPVVWVGLELARGYVVTGFSAALHAHTQYAWTPLLQISDLGGAYAVSFVMIFAAAALVQAAPWWFGGRWQRWPIAATAVLLVLVFGYGYWRLSQAEALAGAEGNKTLKVALIQNSVDTIFTAPPSRQKETFEKYRNQAADAISEHPETQLAIWPESAFNSVLDPWPISDVIVDADASPPDGWPSDDFEKNVAFGRELFNAHTKTAMQRINVRAADGGVEHDTHHIVGALTYHFRNGRIETYNSALLLSPEWEVVERYHKMHRVMFGEYIPFGEALPWLYKLTPLGSGLTRGKSAEAFEVAGVTLAPSICFESIVPHLVRRQIRELKADGREPDMLVNVTNDGWFWGSGLLDLHYKCAIFRAVENRKPMLVAANTGFSTAVDATGKIQAVGSRRDVATLPVAVEGLPMTSFYTQWGDLFAGLCLAVTTVWGSSGFWRGKNQE
jgi:apolipoprotein N-acyltransferase